MPTVVAFSNVRGQATREPVVLANRRRRLSTIVKAHAPKDRPFLVSVHRPDEALHVTDASVRMRATWKSTIVTGDKVILITTLPLGGPGGAGGQGGTSTGKSVGMALASIALAAAVPFAGAAIGGALGVSAALGKAVAAGIVVGEIWRI